ncbi:50S ribosomal protein L19e [Candidatus Woesearchaeota archaeon]|nr:50S ribosomal protein L19e [Candidatus Woesearchaeota archaeon]
MKLNTQKNLASKILEAGKRRIKLDPERLSEIKEAITRSDIKSLIKSGAIKKLNKRGISRVRARFILVQKRKGRKKGKGSLKGKKTSRMPRKRQWINQVRSQRDYLKYLKQKKELSNYNYRLLRNKVKGGLFRSVRHIKLFITEYNLLKKDYGK